MTVWLPYNHHPNTVVGDLRVWRDLYSPQLENARDVLVWLPPGYMSQNERRYPVIYMHDGQNLFDKHTSYSGEWEADETLTALAPEGYAAIVVGLPNMGSNRRIEYSPYPFTVGTEEFQGQGDLYIQFIVETVKPLIDAHFRTRLDSAGTGIVGSSMGGLISLHGFLTRRDVFGICAALSTAYWFGGDSLLQTTIKRADGVGRVYLDVGTKEGNTLGNSGYHADDPDQAYVDGVRALRDALLARGYVSGQNFMYVEQGGAMHREPAWAARLPAALRFLLADVHLSA